MPVVVNTIKETTQAITRPVVLDALKILKQYTGIGNNVEIQVFTGSNASSLPGSLANAGNGDNVRFDSHEKLLADYTERFDENDYATAAVNWKDNVPYFLDAPLQIHMRPVIVKANIEIQIQYRCPNEAAAQRWLADIRQRISMERTVLPMELNYTYQIPMSYMVILAHLHDLRENVAGYNQSYLEWIQACFDDRVTVQKTNGEKGHQFTVCERQGGVLGEFDFTSVPTADRNESNSTWTVGFGFKFTYEKVISAVLEYPIVVHNQVVDAKFRKDPTPYTLTEKRLMNISRRAYEHMPYVAPKEWEHPIGGIVIPTYDDWFPDNFSKATTSVFTTLCTVDSDDPYQICNIRDLGPWQLNPLFLDWIQTNPKLCFSQTRSPLVIEFYTGNTRFTQEALYLDEQLNLRSVTPLNERLIHHLRFALVTDLTVISEPYQRNLRNHGAICQEFLRVIDPTLEQVGLLPKLRGGKMVAPLDYDKAVRAIGTTDPTYKTRPERRRLRVGQFVFYVGDKNACI